MLRLHCLSRSISSKKPGILIQLTVPDSKVVRDMIVMHNAFTRGLASIYMQCVNIEASPGDIPDFVAFCKVWGELLQDHHETEESDVFPFLGKRVPACRG